MHERSEDHIAVLALPASSGSGEQSTITADTKSEIGHDVHSQSGTSTRDGEGDIDDIENAMSLQRQSTELGPAIKVSRLKRRGLFGQLAWVAEVENPKTYPRRTKWFITFVVALAGSTAPMGSSIFFRESLYICSPFVLVPSGLI